MYPKDVLKHSWLFTPHSDQECPGGKHPRNISNSRLHHNHTGVQVGHAEHNMWLVLQNVTLADQGRYCCMVLDIKVLEHKHGSVVQKPHSHVVLHVTPRKGITCVNVKTCDDVLECFLWSATCSE